MHLEYLTLLKKYALELFLIECEKEIPNQDKESEDFNFEVYQKESIDFFNYIYDHLKYPE